MKENPAEEDSMHDLLIMVVSAMPEEIILEMLIDRVNEYIVNKSEDTKGSLMTALYSASIKMSGLSCSEVLETHKLVNEAKDSKRITSFLGECGLTEE